MTEVFYILLNACLSLSLLWLVVGLIAPELLQWKGRKVTRIDLLKVLGLPALCFLVISIGTNAVWAEEWSWYGAVRSSDPAEIQRYAREHPNSPFNSQVSDALEEVYWSNTKKANNKAAFERYLKEHPTGKYVSRVSDEVRWIDTVAANSIMSFDQYLSAFPSGQHVSEAKEFQQALKTDNKPFDKARSTNTVIGYERFLIDFPGHKREADARIAMQNIRSSSITNYLAQKKVEAQASYDKGYFTLTITRLSKEIGEVAILPGTIFELTPVPNSKLVAVSEVHIEIQNDNPVRRAIPVVALKDRAAYGSIEGIQTAIQSASENSELTRLINSQLQKGLKPGPGEPLDRIDMQAAVWIAWGNVTLSEFRSLYSSIVSGFTAAGYALNTAKAMKAVDDAGIDIAKQAIWRERDKVLNDLADGSIKDWLKQRGAKQ